MRKQLIIKIACLTLLVPAPAHAVVLETPKGTVDTDHPTWQVRIDDKRTHYYFDFGTGAGSYNSKGGILQLLYNSDWPDMVQFASWANNYVKHQKADTSIVKVKRPGCVKRTPFGLLHFRFHGRVGCKTLKSVFKPRYCKERDRFRFVCARGSRQIKTGYGFKVTKKRFKNAWRYCGLRNYRHQFLVFTAMDGCPLNVRDDAAITAFISGKRLPDGFSTIAGGKGFRDGNRRMFIDMDYGVANRIPADGRTGKSAVWYRFNHSVNGVSLW